MEETASRGLPARRLPLILATSLLPMLGAFAALGVPELVIHLTERESEWAVKSGREISVAMLWLAAAMSALIAWRHRYPLGWTAAALLVTFVLAAVGRDLWARETEPGWCYAEEVTIRGGGSVLSTSGGYDGCTVLLPARDPLD